MSERRPGAARAIDVTTDSALARAVKRGLGRAPKSLPPWLFYDARGSELFERITELPEYYLTRAEREIFERQADAIVAAAARGESGLLSVLELGAGTATKSQILLTAIVKRQTRCLYVPVDISASALALAAARIGREAPEVDVQPLACRHPEAAKRLKQMPRTRLVLFIGSSIGNFDDDEAVELLTSVRDGLAPGDALLLGADKKKSPERLLAAYDDARGLTAAFNKNVLSRINRELGADFELEAFRHVALWNEERSRIEMHLESLAAQRVRIAALGRTVWLAEGERIHTESSHKYTDEHVEALLGRAGFRREQSFADEQGLFGVHLARTA